MQRDDTQGHTGTHRHGRRRTKSDINPTAVIVNAQYNC